ESSYGFEPKQGVAMPLPACPLLFAHCGTVEEQGFEWTGSSPLVKWMAVTRWMLDVNAGAARSSLRAYRGARGRTIEDSTMVSGGPGFLKEAVVTGTRKGSPCPPV
ncbi:hypothetical protein KUCAC02_028604, partial [Chaenocephalus aceratus]